jgi:hypothetical protein
MALTNRISQNVFRTIAYTKKKWLRSNLFDRNILKILIVINVINDLPKYVLVLLFTYSIRVVKFNFQIVSTTIIVSA